MKTLWKITVNTLHGDPVTEYMEFKKSAQDSAKQAIKYAYFSGRYSGKYCGNVLNYITVEYIQPDMDRWQYAASYHPADGWYRA